MRHSVFAGGKRLRPILCMEAARMVAGRVPPGVEDLGAALEMLHTYSLIHDDLPALDNDDLRRGRPTCHKVFGEAIAILAGDGLQTYAYEVLANLQCPAEARVAIIAEIAHATGTIDGMIGGQVMDLEAEHQHPDAKTLEYIHRSKTGALLTASVVTGGMYAGGDESQVQSLRDFGMNIGLAFQIVDDVLDVTQTSEQLGKTAGKDTATEKSTYPSLFGIEASIKKADELVSKANAALDRFGDRADHLARDCWLPGGAQEVSTPALDVLAIAAHRDDVEQTCGGTLLKMARQGARTGILDLTQGELGSRGSAESRAAEAADAARILQVAWREALDIPDGRVENTYANRIKIARVIREQRPRVVILPYWKGRHPDHYTCATLGYEACFLAGLRRLGHTAATPDVEPFEVHRLRNHDPFVPSRSCTPRSITTCAPRLSWTSPTSSRPSWNPSTPTRSSSPTSPPAAKTSLLTPKFASASPPWLTSTA